MSLYWIPHEIIKNAVKYSLSFRGFEILHENLFVSQDMPEYFAGNGPWMLHDFEIENIRNRSEWDEDSFQDIGVGLLQDLNWRFIDKFVERS